LACEGDAVRIKLAKNLSFREMLDVAFDTGKTIRLGNDFQSIDFRNEYAMSGGREYRYKLSNCVIVIVEKDDGL
jgi:hypothetical protein